MQGAQKRGPEAYKCTMTVLATQATQQVAIFKNLTGDVWHKCHKARPLYCLCKYTLLTALEASTAAAMHAGMRIEVLRKECNILEIEVHRSTLARLALF